MLSSLLTRHFHCRLELQLSSALRVSPLLGESDCACHLIEWVLEPHLTSGDSVTEELASPNSTTASLLPIFDMASSTSTTATPLLPASDFEAKHYYHGLPSRPVLVARTGNDTWKPPTGPEAYLRGKELRPVSNHPLNEVWESHLVVQLFNILDSKEVKWTSIDVVRIGFAEDSVFPVVVWIGVMPGTLSREDGFAVANECKQVLVAKKIHDVEVEIRESVVTRTNLLKITA